MNYWGLGYLTLKVDELELSSSTDFTAATSARVQILICSGSSSVGLPTRIHRNLTPIPFSQERRGFCVSEAHAIESRAQVGWSVLITVKSRSTLGEKISVSVSVFETNAITVDDTVYPQSKAFYLYSKSSTGSKPSGKIVVTIDFVSNHQSPGYLWKISEQESEPRHMLTLASAIRLHPLHGLVAEEDAIMRAIQTVCLQWDDHSLWCAILNAVEANDSSMTTLISMQCVAWTKTYMLVLLQGITLAPQVTMTLLEKQLCIFRHAHSSITEEAMTPGSLVVFVKGLSMWYIQQAFIAVTLLIRIEGLNNLEFISIRQQFSVYDTYLCGEIPSCDVSLLLQDLGCQYLPHEVSCILAALDPSSVGTVDLSDFMLWWCHEPQQSSANKQYYSS